MQICHIAPTSVLSEPHFKVQGSHLCIASQVLKDPVYAQHYRQVPGHVILDVPTREDKLREPYSIELLKQAIDLVQPNEVVLPDAYGLTAQDSIDLAWSEMRLLYPRHVTTRGILGLIAVPRGRNWEEYYYCAQEMTRIPGVVTLGVTTGTFESFKVNREDIVLRLSAEYPHIHLHMLGEHDDLRDMQSKIVRARARSMDTAKLVRFGLDCVHPQYGNVPTYPGRGKDYFERPVSELQMSYIAKNMRYWNSFVERGR